MAVSKLFRTQSTTDPVTELKVDQELISIYYSFNGTFNQQMSRNGKAYPKENKTDQISGNFQIPSVEELEKVVSEFPFLAPLLTQFMDQIAKPFK